MKVLVSDARSRRQLFALRTAARTGHIRKAALVIGRLYRRHPGTADIVFSDGGRLPINLSDAYWARIAVGWEHEPEVRHAIDAALTRHPNSWLLDCGANIGYWGAQYSRRAKVVAVEPLPTIFSALERTATINSFVPINSAVWSSSGEPITLTWRDGFEAGASASHSSGPNSTTVLSTTIFDLIKNHGSGAPVVIKLDVEGAEIAAISGAGAARDLALWIYEDHQSDPTHKVTKHFLNLGYLVQHISDEGNTLPISGPEALDRVKTERNKGYNFVAFSPGGPWGTDY